MGAFFIASMSMFTSCKDYDDDINKNTSAIEALRNQIGTLETSLNQAKTDLNSQNSSLETRIKALEDAASKYATKTDLANYVTEAGLESALNKAVADLEGKIAKLVTIEAMEKALADAKELQDKINEGKADLKDLQELQAKIAAIDPKLETMSSDIATLQAQMSTAQGDIITLKSAVENSETGLAAVNKNLEAQQTAIAELEKALQGKATNDDLNKLYLTVNTITKALENIDVDNINSLMDKLQNKVAELATLKDELEAIKQDISGYANDIKSIAADVEANKQLIEDLKKGMTDAEGKVVNVTTELSVLNIFVEKGLTSIVLKPANYIYGLEAIDVPMLVRQPVLYLDQNKKIKRVPAPLFIEGEEEDECGVVNYGMFNQEAYNSGNVLINSGDITQGQYTTWIGEGWPGAFTVGNGLMSYTCQADYWTRGDFLEEWQLRQGVGQGMVVVGADGVNTDNSPYPVDGVSSYVINDVHWPEGLEFAIPAAASYLSGYNYYYNGMRYTIDANNSNFFNYGDDFNYNFYRYVDIFPQSHAFYHINPTSADLDGAKLHFYMNYPTMTWVMPQTRADSEPADMLFVPNNGLNSQYNGAMEKNYTFTLSNSMVKDGVLDVPFSLDLQTYINTYVVNFVSGYDARKTYSANGSLTEEVSHLDWKSIKMPFTAAQITSNVGGSERVVTSDYAVITPSLLHITALADNKADLRQAKRWSWSDHNMVEQNHLYKHILDAINGEYTHDVVYNGSIDLAPFVETHYYQIGTEFNRDKVMTPQLLQELGLHYEYVLVDWFSDNYAAQQSRHATVDRYTGKLTVHPVFSETGETDVESVGTESCIGKQPIVRVMLVQDVVNPAFDPNDANAGLAQDLELTETTTYKVVDGDSETEVSASVQKNILAVGYIKCRIVRNENVDYFTTICMNPDNDYEVYMDCPGLAIAKWSQIERKLYDVIQLDKTVFEQQYTLDCPTDAQGCKINGARRFVRISLKEYNSLLQAGENSLNYPTNMDADAAGSDSIFVDEASYVKYIEYLFKTSKTLTIEKKVLTDLAFGEAYYRAFAGYVGYTADQSPYNPYGDDARQLEDNVLYWYLGAPSSATPHQYMDNSTVDELVDEKYIEHIAAVNKWGKSTKDLDTWVRFVRHDGLNPIYVRLVIPAGKLIWANGRLTNYTDSYFFEHNSQKPVNSDYLNNPIANQAGYYNGYAPEGKASAPEVHVNVPVPNAEYQTLNELDFAQDMSRYFLSGVQFANDKNSGNYIQKFPHFTGWGLDGMIGGQVDANAKTNLYQNRVEFWFTLPSVAKRNANFTADYRIDQTHYDSRMLFDTIRYQGHAVKVWQVRGKSGRKYTLTLANKDVNGDLVCWANTAKIGTIDFNGQQKYLYDYEGPIERGQYIVAINEQQYDLNADKSGAYPGSSSQGYAPETMFATTYFDYAQPVPIVSLTDESDWYMANPSKVKINQQGFVPVNNYIRYQENAVAEDILNAVPKWDNFTDSYYTDQLESGDENMAWAPGHFAAYIEVVAKHCYEIFDPFQTRFFNVRFLRPVYFNGALAQITADGFTMDLATNTAGITKTRMGFEFRDWRNYKLQSATGKNATGWTNTTNPEKADGTERGEYYTLRIDNGHDGTTPYYNGGDATAPFDWYFFDMEQNKYLLDEIRTDINYNNDRTYREVRSLDGNSILYIYREPIDVSTIHGRALVETLPVASRYASNNGTFQNAELELYTKSDGYLYYQNIQSVVDPFNLYVPIYWSYVLGDTHYVPVNGYETRLHDGHFYYPWNAYYAGNTAGDVDSYEYNYFRAKIFKEWGIIRVVKTINQVLNN